MRILFLDIDTLRPDHLGCYGYHRETSPNIDKIAQEGILFNNYYCSDAPCLPSRTALVTGRFGIHTGVVGHGGSTADVRYEGVKRGFNSRLSVETLPGFLSNHGIRTTTISPFAARHGSWSFYAGWDEIHNTGFGGMETADDVTPIALDWIRTNGANDNWFLHINYWDPHTPYRAPVEMGNPFVNDPITEWLDTQILENHKNMVGGHKAGNINMFSDEIDKISHQLPDGTLLTPPKVETMNDLHQLIDGYDLGIRIVDEHFGIILNLLNEMEILDDLVIIISSDHGENLGELGIYAEHGTADYITTRIPLIIRWPGMKSGHIDHRLHYNLDLLPTLANLLGLPSLEIWDGRSFMPTIRNGQECGRNFLVLSQCAHVCQRSVRFNEWIYIRTYHDGFHLFPKEMLFNILDDPHEQTNLAEVYPEICRTATFHLLNWHDEMMSSMESPLDPLWVVMKEGGPYHAKGKLKEYCSFLKGTSREWAIDLLMEKHPNEFGQTD
jgi:arylsulfatase A-like enzyme